MSKRISDYFQQPDSQAAGSSDKRARYDTNTQDDAEMRSPDSETTIGFGEHMNETIKIVESNLSPFAHHMCMSPVTTLDDAFAWPLRVLTGFVEDQLTANGMLEASNQREGSRETLAHMAVVAFLQDLFSAFGLSGNNSPFAWVSCRARHPAFQVSTLMVEKMFSLEYTTSFSGVDAPGCAVGMIKEMFKAIRMETFALVPKRLSGIQCPKIRSKKACKHLNAKFPYCSSWVVSFHSYKPEKRD